MVAPDGDTWRGTGRERVGGGRAHDDGVSMNYARDVSLDRAQFVQGRAGDVDAGWAFAFIAKGVVLVVDDADTQTVRTVGVADVNCELVRKEDND